MSRAENRHHKERVKKNRIRKIKVKWTSSAMNDPEWVLKQAQKKDNPFTRCSCEMCQNSIQEHSENKRDRKAAKHSIKGEDLED